MNQISSINLSQALEKVRHHKQDTGSMEYQIAKLHFGIKELSEHISKNKKDHPAQRAIVRWVQKMNKYKQYLKKNSPSKYSSLVNTLGMRR